MVETSALQIHEGHAKLRSKDHGTAKGGGVQLQYDGLAKPVSQEKGTVMNFWHGYIGPIVIVGIFVLIVWMEMRDDR